MNVVNILVPEFQINTDSCILFVCVFTAILQQAQKLYPMHTEACEVGRAYGTHEGYQKCIKICNGKL
jgi:hypothetical protein